VSGARNPGGSRLVTAAGLFLLALVHLTLTVDTLLQKSITLDEIAHLPAGLATLETGKFRLYTLNGPLPRLLPALAARGIPHETRPLYDSWFWKADPPSHWHFAFAFQELNTRTPEAAARYFDLYTRGRLVVAGLSALTLPVLFFWGRWWFGPAAGWAAAFLWAFCPNVIAHAGLVTTDLCATSFGVLASFLFARFVDRPTTGRGALAGVGLGLVELTKFSALVLVPVFVLWGLVALRRRVGRALLVPAAGLGAVALLTIGAGYRFEGIGTPLGELPFGSRLLAHRFAGTWAARLPIPVPAPYLRGFDALEQDHETAYPAYLDGELRRKGWATYFLVALAYKVPPGTWALLALAGLLLGRDRPALSRAVPLLLLAGAHLASISLLTDVNLGLRWALPVLPYLFLLAGSALRPGLPKPVLLAAAAALAANAFGASRIHPNELAYFNVFAGGPEKGRFHLIDSNLDWGQDLRPLGRWLERHPERRAGLRVAYAGSVPPELEGVSPYRLAPRDLRYVPPARRLPWERLEDPATWGPQPGAFAVSVNYERGMFFRSHLPRGLAPGVRRATPGALYPGTALLANPPMVYAYFQELEARIEPEVGYSILFYDVSFEDARRLRARLGIPPLPDPKLSAKSDVVPSNGP